VAFSLRPVRFSKDGKIEYLITDKNGHIKWARKAQKDKEKPDEF
jgi:hypothetical protein